MPTTPQKIRWTLTDEAKAKIPTWNQRWIDIITSTAPMTDDDRRITASAIVGMYKAARLSTDDLRIVFVPSPLAAAVVAGAAASFWHQKSSVATRVATDVATRAATSSETRVATGEATSSETRVATGEATRDATSAATSAATRAATRYATSEATSDATSAATRVATDVATGEATREATHAATSVATSAATSDATLGATHAATSVATSEATDAAFSVVLSAALSVVGDTPLARSCIAFSWRMGHGGNHWASWCCYLSFVRDVVGFKCPEHADYTHYENAAIHSSWRYMHHKFCIISDRPRLIKTDDQNLPHCEDGPSHEWADGWKLWNIHGVVVDEQIVLRPDTQTVAQIDADTNNDRRAIRLDRFGTTRYLRESGSDLVDRRDNAIENTKEALFRTKSGHCFLLATCPSGRQTPALPVPTQIQTCAQAAAWLAGDDPKKPRRRIMART